jgi:hypothetical protein
MSCMNRWIVAATFAVLSASTGFAPATAAESTDEALLACADEPDDARRLRCFDAAVAGLRRARATPAASAAAPSSAPAPAASPPAPAAAPSAEEQFGARGDLRPDSRTALSEITGTITALSTRPYGQLVVTLDNGQVWAELAPSKLKLKTGDTVKIEAGALGSYRLVAPNRRSSKVSRVR